MLPATAALPDLAFDAAGLAGVPLCLDAGRMNVLLGCVEDGLSQDTARKLVAANARRRAESAAP